jgi:hypothetical protein
VIRLRLLKKNNAGSFKDDARREFETIIDAISDILDKNLKDPSLGTFIVESISKLMAETPVDAERLLADLHKILAFINSLVQAKVQSVRDMPGNKPLKQVFADYMANDIEFSDLDDLIVKLYGGGSADGDVITDLEVPDPHVYLRDISFLDDLLPGETKATAKDIAAKLMAVINISMPLEEVAKVADGKELEQYKVAKHFETLDEASRKKLLAGFNKKQGIAKEVEGLLNLVTGDQAKLLTHRIFKDTASLRSAANMISDLEEKRDLLKHQKENPTMYLVTKGEQITASDYFKQMQALAKEIEVEKQGLEVAKDLFAQSVLFEDFTASLEKLAKHVDVDIIGALNDVIGRIRGTHTKGLIIPKDILEQTIAAGIKLESILETSVAIIDDVHEITHESIKAKETIDGLVDVLVKKLEKRSIEEHTFFEGGEGVFSKLYEFMQAYIMTWESESNPCISIMIDDAEIDLLTQLNDLIDAVAIRVASLNIDEVSIQALLDETGLASISDLTVPFLEARSHAKAGGGSHDVALKLLKYTPITRQSYDNDEIAQLRDKIEVLNGQLGQFMEFATLMADIGKDLQSLDAFLPRQFCAVDLRTTCAAFHETILTWYNENMGRLYMSEGAGKQKFITAKMTEIKSKLENLDTLVLLLPTETLEKLRVLPLPET